MPEPADVVVIGAGVIGSTLARALQLQGASVLLVDAAAPGSGTSAATFAWFNASSKVRLRYPGTYFELNKVAIDHCYRWADALADGSWLHPIGNIEVVSGEAAIGQLRADVSEMLKRGYPAFLVDPRTAAEMEPALQMPPESVAALYPHEGWIDCAHLIQSVLREFRHLGGRVIESDAVMRFGQKSGRVTTAELASGTIVEGNNFVLATGIDTMQLAGLISVHLPLVDRSSPQVAGLLARCDVVHTESVLHRIVQVNGIAVRPDGDSRLLMVGFHSDLEVTLNTPADTLAGMADGLLGNARAALPALRNVRISLAFTGARAIPIDRVSIVGWAPEVDGLYVVVTHSGITLAAYLAELAAAEIVTGVAQASLEPFRPSRFATVPAAPGDVKTKC